jgi:hypothetical protein
VVAAPLGSVLFSMGKLVNGRWTNEWYASDEKGEGAARFRGRDAPEGHASAGAAQRALGEAKPQK